MNLAEIGDQNSPLRLVGKHILDSSNNKKISPDEFHKPATVLDLYNFLKHNWFYQYERPVIKSGKLYTLVPKTSTEIGVPPYSDYKLTDDLCFMTNSYYDFPMIVERSNPDSVLDEIKKGYSSILNKFKNMNNSNINLCSSSKFSIDILNSYVSVDLVNPEKYIDTLSLNNLKYKIQDKTSVKIDLEILYTLNSEIHSKNFSFNAFKKEKKDDSNDSIIVSDDFIDDFDNIRVEYIDGVIKVLPKNEKVSECIISSCILNYGNI